MEYSNLRDLIAHLEYGTKLHIGVLFLGNYAFEALRPRQESTIHSSAVCTEMKARRGGFERCYLCRNTAIDKACREKQAFGGLCINGVYEYVHPILENGEVVCVLFVGNILPRKDERIKRRLGSETRLLSTMEAEYSSSRCASLCALLESYIRFLHLHALDKGEETEREPLLENIKSYVESNLEYDITLTSLSRIFHYNEKYLGRWFKQKSGLSFRAYLNARRVEYAKRLLLDGHPVALAAVRAGFNNTPYFNRVFKSLTSCTPSEFCRHRGGT